VSLGNGIKRKPLRLAAARTYRQGARALLAATFLPAAFTCACYELLASRTFDVERMFSRLCQFTEKLPPHDSS